MEGVSLPPIERNVVKKGDLEFVEEEEVESAQSDKEETDHQSPSKLNIAFSPVEKKKEENL